MVVFLTVGSLFPFDRLVQAVDEWCGERPGIEVMAQIGESSYTPKHMESRTVLDSAEFDRILTEADLVVSHVGMGVILKALVSNKRLVVMPRKVAFREVTTDHQLATAQALEERLGLNVAWDGDELRERLDGASQLRPGRRLGEYASDELISAIRSFVEGA